MFRILGAYMAIPADIAQVETAPCGRRDLAWARRCHLVETLISVIALADRTSYPPRWTYTLQDQWCSLQVKLRAAVGGGHGYV